MPACWTACGAGYSCSPRQAWADADGLARSPPSEGRSANTRFPHREQRHSRADPGVLPRPGQRRLQQRMEIETLSHLSHWTFTLSQSALFHLRRQTRYHPLREGNVSVLTAGTAAPGRDSARCTQPSSTRSLAAPNAETRRCPHPSAWRRPAPLSHRSPGPCCPLPPPVAMHPAPPSPAPRPVPLPALRWSWSALARCRAAHGSYNTVATPPKVAGRVSLALPPPSRESRFLRQREVVA